MKKGERINTSKGLKAGGITLIALVVTIVVLLILASVSITAVFGDNGLLKLAKEAGEKTNEAVKNDISSMGELEDILHETQTGIVVEKVTDTKPGELEVDASNGNLFTINSIEDLVVFAHNVTSGTETYADKTVKLGLTLDFASTKSYVDANRTDYGKYGYNGELKKLLNESGFIPIGTQERIGEEDWSKKNFHGTFDGDGNTIYNLKIKEEELSDSNKLGTGMFIVNYGTIQNLYIENAQLYIKKECDAWSGIGILSGHNINGAIIEECSVSGKIRGVVSTQCNVGGIVGDNNGILRSSYSNVDISIFAERNNVREGLLVGACSVSSIINDVYSKGNIYPTRGGVIALAVGVSQGNITNSYTIGRIKVEINEENGFQLGTFIQNLLSGSISNCYYLSNCIEITGNGTPSQLRKTGTEKTEEDMKKPDFVTSLNNGQEPAPWKQDTNNINDGYPILSWQ